MASALNSVDIVLLTDARNIDIQLLGTCVVCRQDDLAMLPALIDEDG